MLKDTQEMAENKLLILYILKRANLPLTNEHMAEIIIDTKCMNYFLMQQYLNELKLSKHIIYDSDKNYYYITPLGTKTITMFLNLIDDDKKSRLDKYIVINRERFKKELQVTANYEKIADKQFMVTCKVEENSMTLIELKLNVVTNEQAELLCKNWKSSAQNIYSYVINKLSENS